MSRLNNQKPNESFFSDNKVGSLLSRPKTTTPELVNKKPSIISKKEEIYKLLGPEEAKQFEYKIINELSNSGFSTLEIAESLELTPEQVRHAKKNIKISMARELQNINPNEFLAERLSFYKNIKETAMRAAHTNRARPTIQKPFLELALSAEADMHRLLQVIGFYEYKKFDPGIRGYEAAEDANDIKKIINLIASGDEFKAECFNEKEEEEHIDI